MLSNKSTKSLIVDGRALANPLRACPPEQAVGFYILFIYFFTYVFIITVRASAREYMFAWRRSGDSFRETALSFNISVSAENGTQVA